MLVLSLMLIQQQRRRQQPWNIQRLLLVGHPAAASGAEAAPLAAGAASSDAELQWELQVAAVAEEQENAEMQWLQTLTDS